MSWTMEDFIPWASRDEQMTGILLAFFQVFDEKLDVQCCIAVRPFRRSTELTSDFSAAVLNQVTKLGIGDDRHNRTVSPTLFGVPRVRCRTW